MARSNAWNVVGTVCTFLLLATLAASAQSFTTMVNFAGSNGQNPYASLIQASDGNFYGTTLYGGLNNNGTVFKMTPWGTLTVLWNFTNSCDGAKPYAPLLQASDGNFYGTTYYGGSSGLGALFKITPKGVLTCFYSFSGNTDGAHPVGALIQAKDGALYGTTEEGGPSNKGTIFRITLDKAFKSLYSFHGLDGSGPEAALVQAADGNFYGTTWDGGLGNKGTVFRITPAGSLTKLHDFRPAVVDGTYPFAPLVLGPNGNLYGSTEQGGRFNHGTIFRIAPNGALALLHSFNGADGADPEGSLLMASDGNFYGTAIWGGAKGKGTIFRMTPDGNFTTLHSFDGETEGAHPIAGLIQAANGSFYGTTGWGTTRNMGTIFGMSPMPQQFVAVSPCRLLDTRSSSGPIPGGTFRTFNLPQLALDSSCEDLSSAQSFSLNVTILPADGEPVDFLTIWPAGQPMPRVSTLNSYDGRIKANAAIVPAGADGAVSVYLTDSADVILDINGYFRPPTLNTLQFYPMTPCRVIDTRGGNGFLGGPYLQGNRTRQFPVMISQCFAGISRPEAYSFNVTVVPHEGGQGLTYLTVWPSDLTQPNVSTLNNLTATVVANAAIVLAGSGADGAIRVYASDDSELIVDVNGYFAAPQRGGLSLYSAMPCRGVDTRINPGVPFTGTMAADMTHNVCGPSIPSGSVGAYVFNATVVPSGPLGYLTLWPDGTGLPNVSTLNAYDGVATSNMAIVPNQNGVVDAFGYGTTHLILDSTGYFAP